MAAVTAAQKANFIQAIGPIIQKCAMANGYKVASPVIAQACIESRYGLSELASRHHNYFGLKCGSAWKDRSVNMKTKAEYTPGTLTTIRDSFRAYGSMEEGVKGYFDFISTKRYANLKTAHTPQQYLEMIKADGYATDSGYVQKNMAVIAAHGLTEYDRMVATDNALPKTGNPYPEPVGIVRYNSRGDHARWLQYELNTHGARLIVDGIAGIKTIDALKCFQGKHGLEPDGICGIRTRAALKSLRD